MKRIMMDTQGCVQIISNYTQFSDWWFIGLRTAEEEIYEGVDYCGPMKTIQKRFCLDILEKLTKDFPGGSYLVMKSNPIFPGDRQLMDIGYKYNSSKVLVFIATEGSVSN